MPALAATQFGMFARRLVGAPASLSKAANLEDALNSLNALRATVSVSKGAACGNVSGGEVSVGE